MKYLLITFFFLLTIFAQGQNFITLNEAKSGDTISSDEAIIYGNFIQRLGFSSGGFPQDIRIINLETKEVFTFRVKPTYKSAKENIFIYFIRPGKYAILNYWWTKSTWYGGKFFTEPIFKNIDMTDNLDLKIKSGQINQNELEQFTFEITKNSLNYLGTWHFDKGLVSFTDDKTQFDSLVKSKFKKLDFLSATTILPK
ncbi:hypothetical protein [Flavobacterium sp.]|uniref:hypothetical protein n=1 Tax=Flavobacterium sp. TaxID=239 RepID=UPI0025E98BC3|nr:hypothetical protein [Flavobacterium sp.]